MAAIRSVARAVRTLRAPLISCIVLAGLLCVPVQVREILRVLGEGESPVQLVWALVMCVVAALVVLNSARFVLFRLNMPTDETPSLERSLLQWAPRVFCAVIPFLLGCGLLCAANDARIGSIEEFLVSHSSSLSQMQKAIQGLRATSTQLVWWALGMWVFAAAILKVSRAGEEKPLHRYNVLVIRTISGALWRSLSVLLLMAALVAGVDGFAGAVGSIALIFAFVAWLSVTLAGLFLVADTRGIPLTSILLSISVVFSLLGLNNNHVVRETHLPVGIEVWDAGGPQKYFDAWLESRKDVSHFRRLGKPLPRIHCGRSRRRESMRRHRLQRSWRACKIDVRTLVSTFLQLAACREALLGPQRLPPTPRARCRICPGNLVCGVTCLRAMQKTNWWHLRSVTSLRQSSVPRYSPIYCNAF